MLGGCQGSTGPYFLAPNGRRWGSRFPTITVADMVAVERALSDALGITRQAWMVGLSLGGMQLLEWLVAQPSRVAAAIVIGTAAACSADQIGEDPYGWPSTTMPTNRPGASTPTATSCSAMPWACLIWDGPRRG